MCVVADTAHIKMKVRFGKTTEKWYNNYDDSE